MLVSMPTALPIMAICSLKIVSLTVLFCLITPFTNALSFNYTSFNPNNNNITYDQDASPTGGVIQLTANQRDRELTASFGQATYYQPIQLYDNASGNLTDFTTHFTFVIDSQRRTSYGDGIAFFLAPEGSKPINVTKGGTLALASDGMELNTTVNRFLAVEFDIYSNPWDPKFDHVGIDINSMRSITNITWWSNITGGERNEAWISYDSKTQNLSVNFTGFRNNTVVMQHLSAIVDLKYLPERVTFGFSAATGNASAIHQIYSWDFNSSLEIDNSITDPDPVAAPPPGTNLNVGRRRKNRTGLAVGLGVSGALVGGMVLVWLASLYRKKFGKDEDNGLVIDEDIEDEFERGTGPRKFSYNELAHATDNFKAAGKLGQGGFGGVYKGFLRDSSSYVAIKRVSSGSKQGIKEYASEVKIISRLRHRNLVQLIGWCHDKKELLLVYEFMPNGSLDSHLFTENSLLTWKLRYKIALGLASGLLYLHEGWEQCVVHRDIKSSNVLLDSDFNAKLGDFGLARLVDHAKGSQTTVLAGTMGYLAPECHIAGKASKQSDVYSFGVVALEIACGRKPIDPKAGQGRVNMVEWVWELYGRGKLIEACDPRLCGEFVKQEMEQLMTVGLWCAHPDENSRPSVQQAIHALNFEAPLPILPAKMPVPTYYAPPLNVHAFSLSYSGTDSEGLQSQLSSYTYSTTSSQFTSSSTSSASASLLLAPRV